MKHSEILAQFPALKERVHGQRLVYLDSGATTLKHESVLAATHAYDARYSANVHRGTHHLSELATERFEAARIQIQKLINASSAHEIIFTKGTTESINLVAQCLGLSYLKAGDEIVLSGLEHHSNIVPWQMWAERTGAHIRVVPLDDRGQITLQAVAAQLSDRTKVVSIAHVSNALGTILDIAGITHLAHQKGAVVVVDGAQAVPHLKIDVTALDCDFYAFSGHKMYGPTGVGVLYGKTTWLNRLPPYQGGGDMIERVTFEKTTYAKLPHKFEAGTPNISGVIGLGAAAEFLQSVGHKAIEAHENALLSYATDRLQRIDGLRLIGTAEHKAGVLSFVFDRCHPHDLSTILDRQGIAIRAGHLCAQPALAHFGLHALARASLGIYNTEEDIDALCAGLKKVAEIF